VVGVCTDTHRHTQERTCKTRSRHLRYPRSNCSLYASPRRCLYVQKFRKTEHQYQHTPRLEALYRCIQALYRCIQALYRCLRHQYQHTPGLEALYHCIQALYHCIPSTAVFQHAPWLSVHAVFKRRCFVCTRPPKAELGFATPPAPIP